MLKRKGRRNPYQSAKNKFGVVPKELRTYEDQLFASKGEMIRFLSLKNLERGGAIRNLRRQVKFELEVNAIKICSYVADFSYYENGLLVIEDYKGCETSIFKLKHKLMKAIHGIDVRKTMG